MTEENVEFHEDADNLRPQTLDRHRAILSLSEELEAIDSYGQRIDATSDEVLSTILAHNRNEEIEHAKILLEWLRRADPDFARNLKSDLFVDKASEIEAHGPGPEDDFGADETDGSLGIGSLKEKIRL